jgi:hypothetical protein
MELCTSMMRCLFKFMVCLKTLYSKTANTLVHSKLLCNFVFISEEPQEWNGRE